MIPSKKGKGFHRQVKQLLDAENERRGKRDEHAELICVNSGRNKRQTSIGRIFQRYPPTSRSSNRMAAAHRGNLDVDLIAEENEEEMDAGTSASVEVETMMDDEEEEVAQKNGESVEFMFETLEYCDQKSKREMNANEMPVSSQQVETGTSQIRLVGKLQRTDVEKRINLEHK
jgi:hypothetical protein